MAPWEKSCKRRCWVFWIAKEALPLSDFHLELLRIAFVCLLIALLRASPATAQTLPIQDACTALYGGFPSTTNVICNGSTNFLTTELFFELRFRSSL